MRNINDAIILENLVKYNCDFLPAPKIRIGNFVLIWLPSLETWLVGEATETSVVTLYSIVEVIEYLVSQKVLTHEEANEIKNFAPSEFGVIPSSEKNINDLAKQSFWNRIENFTAEPQKFSVVSPRSFNEENTKEITKLSTFKKEMKEIVNLLDTLEKIERVLEK